MASSSYPAPFHFKGNNNDLKWIRNSVRTKKWFGLNPEQNCGGTNAAAALRVLLFRCLCVRTQAWEDLSYPVRNGQEKEEKQKFLPLIGTKCLIDTGRRLLPCLGDSQLCCEPVSWNWHLKSWPSFPWRKNPSVIPNIFVVKAQMRKTCCRILDLERGSWIPISSMEVLLVDLASFSWRKEQEPKHDSSTTASWKPSPLGYRVNLSSLLPCWKVTWYLWHFSKSQV